MAESQTAYTHADWVAEATRRFGADPRGWKFVCPSCKVQTELSEWIKLELPEGVWAFSCIGRWKKERGEAFAHGKVKQPCNYAGGGLFRLNPVTVQKPNGDAIRVFAFAEVAEG